MNSILDIYERYKALHELRDVGILTAFEELVRQTSLYDAIEFSTKFERQAETLRANPLRFSLWKYDPKSQIDAAFLLQSFRFFESAAKTTQAAERLHDLTSVRIAIPGSDLRFLSTGLEIHQEASNTRLKLYFGYKPRNRRLPHFIIRHELNLRGHFLMSKYEALSCADPLVRFRLSDIPEILWKQPFVIVFVQADRLHFKFDPTSDLDKKLDSINTLIPDSEITAYVHRMVENGFDPVVLTFPRHEIVQHKINTLTLYFREFGWSQRSGRTNGRDDGAKTKRFNMGR